MSTQLAIETTLSTFQQLRDRFGLQRAADTSFFKEWQNLAIEIADDDKIFLDHLQQRYRYYYDADLLSEGTVLFSIVSPLLEHLGFHEPPFMVRSEVPVSLEVQDRDEVYRGRIDVLVLQDLLWILTIEAKRSKFAVDIALPQCLAYMSAAKAPTTFGLVTNGSDFMFCKLEESIYDFSDPFSLLSHRNQLYEVATILSLLKNVNAT